MYATAFRNPSVLKDKHSTKTIKTGESERREFEKEISEKDDIRRCCR